MYTDESVKLNEEVFTNIQITSQENMIIKSTDSEENKHENKPIYINHKIYNNDDDDSSESDKIFTKPIYKEENKPNETKVKIIEPVNKEPVNKEPVNKESVNKTKNEKKVKPLKKSNKSCKTKKPEINYDSDISIHSDKSV